MLSLKKSCSIGSSCKSAAVTTCGDAVEKYYNTLYGKELSFVPPSFRQLTFAWAHLITNKSDWELHGVRSNMSSFEWDNAMLPTPYSTPLANGVVTDVANQSYVLSVISALPQDHTFWTPSWFQYPQTAINRYNPRWWNEYYFTWLLENTTITDPCSGVYDNVVTADQLTNPQMEVTNGGGIDPGGSCSYFFYVAKGSGVTITPSKIVVALNKLHAYYWYEWQKVPAGPTREQTAFSSTFAALLPLGLDTLLDAALVNPAGFFQLSTGNINPLLWPKIRPDFPATGLAQYDVNNSTRNLFAMICYLIGMKPFAVGAFAPLPPNLSYSMCNSTQAYRSSTPSTAQAGTPIQPYEYWIQTITNLSVEDNVLDAYVELIIRDAALNVDAVISLSQWNALGGWTAEMPSYFQGSRVANPSVSDTFSCPSPSPPGGATGLRTTFGCKFLPITTWGVLGVQTTDDIQYETNCATFTVNPLFSNTDTSCNQ